LKLAKDYTEADINYKLTGDDYEETAIDIFEKLIDLIRGKNIEVYFFLAPYNPVFFKSVGTSVTLPR
jgi:hypothetical protein